MSESKSGFVRIEDTYLKSSFYEQVVEHVFVSEVLQEIWYGFGITAEVLRSEVDASGYDVVFECNGVLRHVQLKTSKPDARVGGQKINVALAEKPSGCVVWILRHEEHASRRMRLSYLFFGGSPGQPLPQLTNYRVAKHSKGDASGKKKERPRIRIVPKSQFTPVSTTQELVGLMFGSLLPIDRNTLEQIQENLTVDKDTSDV